MHWGRRAAPVTYCSLASSIFSVPSSKMFSFWRSSRGCIGACSAPGTAGAEDAPGAAPAGGAGWAGGASGAACSPRELRQKLNIFEDGTLKMDEAKEQ